jgi:hypothetical protein
MTAVMTLEAISPDYLIAKAECDKATKALKGAQGQLEMMGSGNDQHAKELAEKSRSGLPMRTNQQILQYGSGSGYEIVYTACRCSDLVISCSHDPRMAPYSDAVLAAAEKRIVKAEKTLSRASATLADTPSSFDAFEHTRDVGARYCWWPNDVYVDPKLRRWRGQPISDEKVAEIGPHSLRHGIEVGGIVEVPT